MGEKFLAPRLYVAWTHSRHSPATCVNGCSRERATGRATCPGGSASLVDREAGVLSEDRRVELAARIAQRAFGLGPLEPLLADPAVDEIMVSGTAPVWVERRGRLECTGVRFEREADLRDAIERILAPLGRRADESEPLCDARLPDGSRVNVVLPPLALDGPGVDDPPLPPPRALAGGPGGERDAGPPACSTSSRAPCAPARACWSAAAPAPARPRR